MNIDNRTKMIKAMEYIARQVNNEEVLEYWLSCGVSDGEIEPGDLNAPDDGFDEYYLEDDTFSELMHTFLSLMVMAKKDGGLYCDGVIDKTSSVVC